MQRMQMGGMHRFEVMTEIPADHGDGVTDIESRLINWGRWCNGSKSSSGGHCGSIEWQWVDKWKQKYGWADPPDTNRILAKVDVLDAELIQSTMIYLPITFRQVLSMRYVHQKSAKRTAYEVGCKEWALDAVVSDAKNALKTCLTGLKKHG